MTAWLQTNRWLLDAGAEVVLAVRDPAVPVPEAVLRAVPADQRERAGRALQPAEGARILFRAGFLATWLAERLGRNLDEVRLARPPGQRPRLLRPGPELSLSHSGEAVAAAISFTGRIGVDVEEERSLDDLPGMLRVIGHPDELRFVEAAAPEERSAAFFTVWTRKEALLKARGTGFQEDPRRVSTLALPEGAQLDEWRVGALRLAVVRLPVEPAP